MIYKCEKCNKIFTQKSHYTNHINRKYPCKSANNNILQKLIQKVEEQDKIITELKNNTKINNTINNNTINNNYVNISININPFKNEDLSHLKLSDFKKIIDCGYQCVLSYLDNVHFNKDKPENHNLLLTNLRSNIIKVLNEDKNWEAQDLQEVIDYLIDKSTDIINDKYNEIKDKINYNSKGFDRYYNTYENEQLNPMGLVLDLIKK
jgi:uncharacterized C2H2 Zn-finger protein